ncbi:tetratricopeptide repeat protein [Sulfuricurvum sp. IAE1]|jgi:tetratricopeptide (TPR) repeat protein|uniref:tetratricopeptide repeat protein n=1 Tax=Sulfuricurvum sp. IAE1 TaxID=2546102 RepID=UPI001048C88C|nr:tetratricopeptide repeat protein [Sulfuricurvum sp. IAE1]MDD3770316.1 tetratricopeptide repeat protein [Sulfuricurvum sp.]MDX9966374.1 tetratricopeptide repeat protein [Sulfuricurvum sp.]TDA62618.1 tetratricopeptide repeat protein [Sulfuricurvum sp. IAE1]
MDTFFIEFRDPLFGVIVFFFLLFVLSFLSYWWGRHKTAKGHRDLESFLGKFESLEDENRLRDQVQTNSLPNESWLMLAHSYEMQGNFEKSVEIYHALLSKNRETTFQKEVLLLLGKNYFKAGFLERSRQTFLQILQNHPRSPQALHYLILIYEQLRQYDKALEVMESLQEIASDSLDEKLYLECRLLLGDHTVGTDEKGERLIELYERHRKLGYLVFEWLFANRPALAWSRFDQSLAPRLSDVLWRLRDDNLDLDIIASNTYLRELFSAKGSVSLAEGSGVFELDVLIALRKCGMGKAALQFEYACGECKQISFLPFHRCPHCHAIDTVEVMMNLSRERYEENNSLQ